MKYRVWTDGSCLGTKVGGWAWVTDFGPYDCGQEIDTTNQKMELEAAIQGALSFAGRCDQLVIISDSAYVVNCFRDKWHEGWVKRGWKNANGKPVANRERWEALIDLVRYHGIEFEHVRGHNGDPMNELADKLATNAARGIFRMEQMK